MSLENFLLNELKRHGVWNMHSTVRKETTETTEDSDELLTEIDNLKIDIERLYMQIESLKEIKDAQAEYIVYLENLINVMGEDYND